MSDSETSPDPANRNAADVSPVTLWLRQLEPEDSQAAQPLYEHFCSRLQELARQRIPANVRGAYDQDEESVSAFHSLFQGIREQRYQLQDRADFWRLLLTIAERKIAHRTNSIGMKFILIPPGEFLMGSSPAEIEAAIEIVGPGENVKHWRTNIRSEGPQHKVILTQPFYLGIHEVTQAAYEKVMGRNPAHFAATGNGKDTVAGMETANHPVEMVSWNDAVEFCAKLSEQEQLNPLHLRDGETITALDETGYRLPSEAQWEFACRAGTNTRFWSGDRDEDLLLAGWSLTNSGGRTHVVGERQASPFGLHDMHGNAWEWVQDGWQATAYSQRSEAPAINPNIPFSGSSARAIRGGYSNDNAFICRAATRAPDNSALHHKHIGFRVLLPMMTGASQTTR